MLLRTFCVKHKVSHRISNDITLYPLHGRTPLGLPYVTGRYDFRLNSGAGSFVQNCHNWGTKESAHISGMHVHSEGFPYNYILIV